MRELSFRSADELAHAYILLSPSAEEREQTAQRLASAVLCQNLILFQTEYNIFKNKRIKK